MPTAAALPVPYESESLSNVHHFAVPAAAPPAIELVRRRGSAEQGRALEALGHAVEYLVDSRLYSEERNEEEALQILMRMSRAVFAECPEVISLRRRMKGWMTENVLGPRQR